ncbi:hypothetical protein KNV97_00110 [Vibrio ostreae]|uniref:Uncharacterized protein n=1 Tax=Vibrio ostreae TaxID=2841925 RepID=A0A975U7B3_9VIBR|nr:hypothetical protein [Vibrio ostreae]QXO16569.1 hypothetical protein KNV97_00110 [Vibrio ostreae]
MAKHGRRIIHKGSWKHQGQFFRIHRLLPLFLIQGNLTQAVPCLVVVPAIDNGPETCSAPDGGFALGPDTAPESLLEAPAQVDVCPAMLKKAIRINGADVTAAQRGQVMAQFEPIVILA